MTFNLVDLCPSTPRGPLPAQGTTCPPLDVQIQFLKPLKLRGFARSDEYGLSFFARSCEPATEIDVPSVARQFLAALEG